MLCEQDLVDRRAGPVRQHEEGFVPNASRDGHRGQEPRAPVEQEHEDDGCRRHVWPAWAAGPPEEGKRSGERTELDGLDGPKYCVIQRDVRHRPHPDRDECDGCNARRRDEQQGQPKPDGQGVSFKVRILKGVSFSSTSPSFTPSTPTATAT